MNGGEPPLARAARLLAEAESGGSTSTRWERGETERGRGRLQRGAFTWLRAGGGGCQVVAALVVVIPVHTVLAPHVGSTHQKGLN